MINYTVHAAQEDDREDLDAFEQRASEPEISLDELLNDLKEHGRRRDKNRPLPR